MKYGFSALSLKQETIEKVRAFQILAIAQRREMFSLSQAIDLAVELALIKLKEEKGE